MTEQTCSILITKKPKHNTDNKGKLYCHGFCKPLLHPRQIHYAVAPGFAQLHAIKILHLD
jgi:hypothetical protein